MSYYRLIAIFRAVKVKTFRRKILVGVFRQITLHQSNSWRHFLLLSSWFYWSTQSPRLNLCFFLHYWPRTLFEMDYRYLAGVIPLWSPTPGSVLLLLVSRREQTLQQLVALRHGGTRTRRPVLKREMWIRMGMGDNVRYIFNCSQCLV